MKKMICLKGLCLKVSETLNTKKIEKKKKEKKNHWHFKVNLFLAVPIYLCLKLTFP